LFWHEIQRYRATLKRINPSASRVHRAGEKPRKTQEVAGQPGETAAQTQLKD
jgi:hypothetical protein